MRPRSMTGFGRGELVTSSGNWVAEVRSVNHRFLDLRITLPRPYVGLEDRVRKIVATYIDRGRVEVNIQQTDSSKSGPVLQVNSELASQYYSCLNQVRDELKIDGSITLADMLNMRDIIRQQEQSPDLDEDWKDIEAVTISAFVACNAMREQEGESLKHELTARLVNFTASVDAVRVKVPEILEQRQAELKTRISKLLAGMDIDQARFTQETAILADKSDVTEELVRLQSHISQFHAFMESEEAVGRRLDFLLQEFLREVNTLASKINNSNVAHLTVEMKNEVEKLREQVQNLE